MCTVKGLSRLPAWRWWTAKDKGELGNSAKTTWCIALVTSDKKFEWLIMGWTTGFSFRRNLPAHWYIQSSDAWFDRELTSGNTAQWSKMHDFELLRGINASVGWWVQDDPPSTRSPRPCFQLVHRQHRHSCQIFSPLARWPTLSCRVCQPCDFRHVFLLMNGENSTSRWHTPLLL